MSAGLFHEVFLKGVTSTTDVLLVNYFSMCFCHVFCFFAHDVMVS